MDCSRAQTRDPDDWLEAAPDFSRPIVAELRDWIFRTTPDLSESIKWNMLCFSGRKLVVGLSACRKHVGITFFRGTELADPAKLFSDGEGNTNIRSIRLTKLSDLNRNAFAALLIAAADLDAQPDLPPAPKVKRAPWPVPAFFAKALQANAAAAKNFGKFAPTYQREYLVWVTTAKRLETREKRLAETLRALAAGRKWLDRKSA